MNFLKYNNDPLQKQLSDILIYGADGPKTATSWSSFLNEDILKEEQLTQTYYEIARANPKAPVKCVLDQAEKDLKVKDVYLVHSAIKNFVNFYPDARKLNLRIPPLIRRAPKNTLPKKRIPLAPGPLTGAPSQVPENEEDLIEYWREDTNLNDHHLHWHDVYGNNRVNDPNNPGSFLWKSRQGELFICMHRQMVARYYAERLAAGLPVVIALADYTKPIVEGYDASDVTGKVSRPADLTLKDVQVVNDKGEVVVSITVDSLAQNRDLLERTIDQGYFETADGSKVPTQGNLNLLGTAIEAGISERTYKEYNSSVWKNGEKDIYGGFHNNGHMLLALITDDPTDTVNSLGVVGDNATASRDPVFYRWHKYVDELFVRYQKKLPPNDYSDSPPICIRDVHLVFKDKIDAIKSLAGSKDRTAIEKAAQSWGESNIGKINKVSTDTLETKIKTRTIDLTTTTDDLTDTAVVDYLMPREWYYFFCVENTSNQKVTAAFRVFIVPVTFEEQFNCYIEVDKFQKDIPAKSKSTIARDCDRAAPVAQPPKKTPEQMDDNQDDSDIQAATDAIQKWNLQYCECGWPFNLLLPRGTPNGLQYKLVVFISAGELHKVNAECGSLSMCGAQELDGEYPDSKEMGYPFNRPLNGNLKKTFGNMKNVAIKDFKIKHVNDFPDFTPSKSSV